MHRIAWSAWALLAAAACPVAAQGPGIGNLSYGPGQLFQPISVIKSQNGGGVPGPSAPARVTVLYDATDGKTRSIAGRWNDVLPDHQYSELLKNLAVQDDGVHLVTEEMEHGDLRTLYEADGTLQSDVFRLAATEKSMIFLSFNFPHGDELTPHQKDSVRETRMVLEHLVKEIDPEFTNSAL